MLMTPPETLNSIFWPLFRPACRRTDGGTTSCVLFFTVTVIVDGTFELRSCFQCGAARADSQISGPAKQPFGRIIQNYLQVGARLGQAFYRPSPGTRMYDNEHWRRQDRKSTR